MDKSRLLYCALLFGVVAVAAGLSYGSDELRGLLGCGVGVLFGGGLCLVSHHLLARVQKAEGQQMVTAMVAATLVSFILLIAGVLAVRFLWREVLEPVALTALGVYLVHRFYEALEANLRLDAAKVERKSLSE